MFYCQIKKKKRTKSLQKYRIIHIIIYIRPLDLLNQYYLLKLSNFK